MKPAALGWLMHLFERLQRRDPPPPPRIDREALRDEMTRSDPDFARVRSVHHDAFGVLGARSLADGVALRRERRFWEEHPTP